jgi:superkiller protein 3
VQLNPNESLFWYAYGEIYRLQDRTDEAISAYKKASDIDPPYTKAMLKLGLLLTAKKDYDEAEQVLTNAIRREPKNPLGYLEMGDLQAAKRKNKLAIENYQKYVDLTQKGDPERDRAQAAIKDLKRK